MRKIAAGNWKMNGKRENLAQLEKLSNFKKSKSIDVIICPPATLISSCIENYKNIIFGAQDCHWNENGAHTGDISAAMIKDLGATHVIVGHSERRTDHNETDEIVYKKAQAAHKSGLIAIVCVGETLEQRETGKTLDILGKQLASSLPDNSNEENTIIAYEPVWAIGTGLTPSLDEISSAHQFIRETLVIQLGEVGKKIPLLYGGSVKASNASDIFSVENVNGALVGGASLKFDDFSPIISALDNSS